MMRFLLTSVLIGTFAFLSGCENQSKSPPVTGKEETPAYAMRETKKNVRASEKNPQVVSGNTFEDFDLSFKLERPSADWRFMNQEQSASISADSTMGIINPGLKAYMVLIAEEFDDVTLEQYISLVLRGGPLEVAKDLERQEITVDGFPGIRLKRRAKIEGLDFTYSILYVKRGTFFYQLMGWSLTGQFAKAEPGILQVSNSLSFVNDRPPRVRLTKTTADDQTFEWRIADGVYSNGAFGFRITPVDGFRIAAKNDLDVMNASASAGVFGTESTFNQIYIVEAIGDIDRDKFIKIIYQNINQEMEVEEKPPSEMVSIAGIEAEQLNYQGVEVDGATFDFSETLFFRGDYFFRIQSWWPTSDAEKNQQVLKNSYAMLEWIDESETADVRKKLLAADSNNAVGIDYAMRNGVFYDFDYGYSLKVPPGLWEATTGDTVQQENDVARVIFEQPAEGVQVVVIPEILKASNAEFHDLLRKSNEVPADQQIQKFQQKDIEVLVSAVDRVVDDTPMTYRLITATRGDRCLQLMMYGLQSLSKNLDRRLPELIKGLDFPVRPFPKETRRGQTIINHRLGFKTSASTGWTAKSVPIQQIESVGSIVAYSKGEAACVIMGVCAPWGFNHEVAIDALAKSSAVQITPGSRQEGTSTLAGLDARQITMEGRQNGRKAFVKVWMAQRGHTTYIMLVIGDQGSVNEKKADQYKKFLTLID